MKKLPQLFGATLLGFLAWTSTAVQAQTTKLPPWIGKKVGTPAPAPQPSSQPSQPLPPTLPGESRPDVIVVERAPTTASPEYSVRNRKGHPHGMPPGQAKKRGYASNPSNGGLPPGQAKKAYRGAAPATGAVYTKEHKHEHKGKSKGKWMDKR